MQSGGRGGEEREGVWSIPSEFSGRSDGCLRICSVVCSERLCGEVRSQQQLIEQQQGDYDQLARTEARAQRELAAIARSKVRPAARSKVRPAVRSKVRPA